MEIDGLEVLVVFESFKPYYIFQKKSVFRRNSLISYLLEINLVVC